MPVSKHPEGTHATSVALAAVQCTSTGHMAYPTQTNNMDANPAPSYSCPSGQRDTKNRSLMRTPIKLLTLKTPERSPITLKRHSSTIPQFTRLLLSQPQKATSKTQF